MSQIEVKIIRDIIITRDKPENEPVSGEGISEFVFRAKAGETICRDEETKSVYLKFKIKKKIKLAPIDSPELAEVVWSKVLEQLDDIKKNEWIQVMKEELVDRISKSCKKSHYSVQKQYEFIKEHPNTILPSELGYEDTLAAFEEALLKYDKRIEKKKERRERQESN